MSQTDEVTQQQNAAQRDATPKRLAVKVSRGSTPERAMLSKKGPPLHLADDQDEWEEF